MKLPIEKSKGPWKKGKKTEANLKNIKKKIIFKINENKKNNNYSSKIDNQKVNNLISTKDYEKLRSYLIESGAGEYYDFENYIREKTPLSDDEINEVLNNTF